ncbi:hypothetical protein [Mariniblastus fucicola]|uniref:Uncharacterized protein n=1 Tax=Mariniblastus fucicola TaxID=980251 RepID=A0A5B9P4E2_9BACT|nr:hypothetical protein [Mariniblastus fucicola]QEG20369.1 hypothetical protein MFFC18_02170 [Mariniblastus fucicola]
MNEVLLFLNDPVILWSLLGASILLVLIDYLFPVDWPAYVGYLFFSIFIGTTASLTPLMSLFAMVAVFSFLLTMHKAVFSKYLTNAPHHERNRVVRQEPQPTNWNSEDARTESTVSHREPATEKV